MRIKSVRIKNFRVFHDETIHFDPYTCLVGANGAGKSTILTALNLFFRETTETATNLLELQREDFHGGNIAQPVEITVTFIDLPEPAQQEFSDYYRQNELIVSAVATFDPQSERAVVNQFGQRKGVAKFRPFFEAEKEKVAVASLKEMYGDFRTEFTDLPEANSKAKMIGALHHYEDGHPELTELIPSEDQFYGFTKGVNQLARYLQWIFVPAVKDVSMEQLEARDTALGRLLSRTVRSRVSFDERLQAIRETTQAQYQQMLAEYQGTLNELSTSLGARLAEWAHPEAHLTIKWQQDIQKSVRLEEPFAQILVREGNFSGNLSRFGHGLQRAYLLALLQELSNTESEGQPALVLAIEEPELYQHPPQCQHLATILRDLTTRTSQVLVATHSPYFVSGLVFEHVRMVRKDLRHSRASVSQMAVAELRRNLTEALEGPPPKNDHGMLAKIHQALQPGLGEIFFAPFLVLTEGREDIAYILTYLTLMGCSDSLRRVGCHFVPTEGKSKLLVPLAITRHLNIPAYVVFDSDGHSRDKSGSREKHRKDNTAILRLAGIRSPNPFPTDTLWFDSGAMWMSEIGDVVAKELGSSWKQIKRKLEVTYGHAGNLDKNPLFISECLHMAWEQGSRSTTLQRLSEEILRFCRASR